MGVGGGGAARGGGGPALASSGSRRQPARTRRSSKGRRPLILSIGLRAPASAPRAVPHSASRDRLQVTTSTETLGAIPRRCHAAQNHLEGAGRHADWRQHRRGRGAAGGRRVGARRHAAAAAPAAAGRAGAHARGDRRQVPVVCQLSGRESTSPGAAGGRNDPPRPQPKPTTPPRRIARARSPTTWPSRPTRRQTLHGTWTTRSGGTK
jgi:hypothetical protein